jgi:uroporphyrinogen-III synthase
MSAAPLSGRRILVTRPRLPGQRGDPLAALLEAAGAEVLWLPALEIRPPDDWGPFDAAMARLHAFDWAVFTSRNGVAGFWGRLSTLGMHWNERPRAAAVGQKTATALAEIGRAEVHLAPQPLATALARSLADECPGRRFLWPRAQWTPGALAQGLLRCGAAEVAGVACYSARPSSADAGPAREALRAGQVDAVTFASARSVEATLEALGAGARQWISLLPKFCIGPVTARACEDLGLGSPSVADGSVEGLAGKVVAGLGERQGG